MSGKTWVKDFFSPPLSSTQRKIIERLEKHTTVMLSVYNEIELKITDEIGRHSVLASIVDAAVIYEEKHTIKNNFKVLNEVLRIPGQSDQSFRSKPTTYSGPFRPLIPI